MAFLTQFNNSYLAPNAVLAAVRTSVADATTLATYNMGVSGLSFLKGRIVAKSGAGVYTSAGTWAFQIAVSPSTGVTTLATIIALTPGYISSVELAATNTAAPNLGFMTWEFEGYVNSTSGFQFVRVSPVVTATIPGTYDIQFFAA